MTWDTKPSEFTVTIKDDFKKLRNEIALFGLRGVVLRTPVDTGRARGSWSVSMNAIRTVDRGPQGSESQATSASMNSGVAEIASADPFGVLYIVNAIPYIGFLENGSSKQNPAGMLATTFNDIRVRYG